MRTALSVLLLFFIVWGTRAAPDADATVPVRLLPLKAAFVTNELGHEVKLFSRAGIKAEFRRVRSALHEIDLKGAPVLTDGWTHNIAEAEWPVMACAYFGYACGNLAEGDPTLREEALAEMRWLLEALQSRRLSGFMEPHFGAPFGPGKINAAVFVHGHFLNLALRYRQLSKDQHFDSLTKRIAEALINEIKATDHGILRSSDNFPAYAALARYDRLFGQNTLALREKFVRNVQAAYLDKATGMICTYVDADRKLQLQGPRGISTMYGLHFLGQLSKPLAQEQYGLAYKYFVRTALGVGAVKEFPPGVDGQADIDSGPTILGFGPSASGFAIAAAALMNDDKTAVALLRSTAVVGQPVLQGGELRYEAMPPVGQAVILFGKSVMFLPAQDPSHRSP